MNELQKQLESLLAEVTDYNNKPTKANSKRVRTKLGGLKKNVTSIRAELVAKDSKGYN
jgi:hypothetical protein